MTASPLPIFDGHNDTLLRLWRLAAKEGADPVAAFLEGGRGGHIDLPKARAGGFAGGMFAVFVPSPGGDAARMDRMMQAPAYDLPLPPELRPEAANGPAVAMTALLHRIAAASDGALTVCRTAADVRAARAAGSIAAVLHFEGAEMVPDLDSLEVWHAAGLRSLGPVWSRPTRYGHGVPFRFPGTPDTGEGLTPAGKDLVRACNRLGVMIDLSHLNAAGVRDVAAISDKPLVATHSNAHALCPHTRNLTDDQLAMIRDSGGLVGVNFAASFIRPDGRMSADTPLEQLVRHIDHLLERLGPGGVALGSDFDGATVPAELGDAAGLPALVGALRQFGYDEATLERVLWSNWVSVLERTWGG